MTPQHQWTPPLSLVEQWKKEWEYYTHVENMPTGSNRLDYIAAQAARWGADQVLDSLTDEELKRLFSRKIKKVEDNYRKALDSCRRLSDQLQKLEEQHD